MLPVSRCNLSFEGHCAYEADDAEPNGYGSFAFVRYDQERRIMTPVLMFWSDKAKGTEASIQARHGEIYLWLDNNRTFADLKQFGMERGNVCLSCTEGTDSRRYNRDGSSSEGHAESSAEYFCQGVQENNVEASDCRCHTEDKK